ncbi:MAG: class I SAM-dependent methyltransferase [Pseudomonadota bacterium]
MSEVKTSKWPKTFDALTEQQAQISDDFMKYWHTVLPNKYGIVDKFNHEYPVIHAPKNFVTTLEIGAGIGEHLLYEKLTPRQEKNYVATDIRQNMIDELKNRFPNITAMVADCQKPMDFADGYFDRVVAIHILEHLPNLPLAVREMHRLCKKGTGVLSIVIPCEGSAAYTLARKISAQRIFEQRYNQSYRWFIEREHINLPNEIFEELKPYFTLTHARYFPFPVHLQFCNLCIGATFSPK